jgi:hypothetical protein
VAHLQVLEKERQELSQLPVQQLSVRDRQRHAAATAIQANWRSYTTRRKFSALLAAQVSWPHCCS